MELWLRGLAAAVGKDGEGVPKERLPGVAVVHELGLGALRDVEIFLARGRPQMNRIQAVGNPETRHPQVYGLDSAGTDSVPSPRKKYVESGAEVVWVAAGS